MDILPALIAGTVAVVGWYATYAYTKRREDRTRRIEIRLRYRARQIEELYGPLLSLIEQIFNVWRVRQRILQATKYPPEDERRIRDFFWQRYFTPLHQEIGTLLRTKLYLLDEGRLPASFQEYLEHATQESCQQHLWRELQIDTSHARGRPWPQEFHSDVKETLRRLMAEHQSGLAELETVGIRSRREAA